MSFVLLFNTSSVFNRILNHKFVKALKTQAHTHTLAYTERGLYIDRTHAHNAHTHIRDCIHVGAIEC